VLDEFGFLRKYLFVECVFEVVGFFFVCVVESVKLVVKNVV
jgi:hypothetical protein